MLNKRGIIVSLVLGASLLTACSSGVGLTDIEASYRQAYLADGNTLQTADLKMYKTCKGTELRPTCKENSLNSLDAAQQFLSDIKVVRSPGRYAKGDPWLRKGLQEVIDGVSLRIKAVDDQNLDEAHQAEDVLNQSVLDLDKAFGLFIQNQ